jgi:hypothetical protein
MAGSLKSKPENINFFIVKEDMNHETKTYRIGFGSDWHDDRGNGFRG